MKCPRWPLVDTLVIWICITSQLSFSIIHRHNRNSILWPVNVAERSKFSVAKPWQSAIIRAIKPGVKPSLHSINPDPVEHNYKKWKDEQDRNLISGSKRLHGFITTGHSRFGTFGIKCKHKIKYKPIDDADVKRLQYGPFTCWALEEQTSSAASVASGRISCIFGGFRRFLLDLIYPLAVRKEYYNFAHWRMLERIALSAGQVIASNIKQEFQCFPLQEATKGPFFWMNKLNNGKVGHALTTIVIKDFVSRILHFFWFGKIGAGFDDNPKAFRILGSILCTFSNVADFVKNICGIEPRMIFTICSNIVRQLGLLTMTASQGPFYNSFHIKNAATNIGEITAKLEAQNPVCDFLGIAIATYLLQFCETQSIAIKAGIFAIASCIANLASYMAVKGIVFRNLNAPRCFIVLEDFASTLLRRLDRYLRYHTTQLDRLNEDSDDIASSSNSCFDDDECGAIAELIYNYEFDTAAKLLHRFTSVHLCNKLRAARRMPQVDDFSDDDDITVDEYLGYHNDTPFPGEPLNLVQKKIKIKFLTPEAVAKREPLQFPGSDGALRLGAIKYSLNDLSVCQATLTEYLKIFKGEKFVVVLGSNGIVEASIHPQARPKDAIMAILTYNIAEKLWTVVTESTETEFADLRFEQIWDMCKRSAVGLKEVLLHLKSRNPKRRLSTDGKQLQEEKETWERGIETVKYAYTMAKACIDEVISNIEAARWDVDKFEFATPKQ